MSSFKLRPHHGLCTAFFIGKGYSSEFTANMADCIAMLSRTSPLVRLTVGTDIICEKCPNNTNGKCSDAKPDIYDRKVLELIGIPENTELQWTAYRDMVRAEIIEKGRLCQVCSGCRWYEICNNTKKQT